MQEYKIIVEYVRGGKTYHDQWFIWAENVDDAIELVRHRFHGLNDHLFVGSKDATFSIAEVIKKSETYKTKESDTAVSMRHPNLVGKVSGFAREVETEDGMAGVLIFIPTGVGEILIDLIEVK